MDEFDEELEQELHEFSQEIGQKIIEISEKIHPVDIHTMDDLLDSHRDNQSDFSW